MSTHNIPFQYKKKKFTLNYQNLQLWDLFSKGLKNEFKIAVVNEPSVSTVYGLVV